MSRVAFLPLDDRPVNYDYPEYLARAAGLDLLQPPREWLGNPWRSSRHAELIAWLPQAMAKSDALIIAIDTLAYGGLIPSRTSSEPAEIILKRLEVLRELQSINPEKPILAFNVILRISRANSSEEEKPYWATYGSHMFRLSYLEHKSQLGEVSETEKNECGVLRSQIPDDIYNDYQQGRQRNHTINHTMLDWLEYGVFDYLLLPQDDTADYGWNIAEARDLQTAIRTRGLTERAITYPGADEIGCLLLARYICQTRDLRPRVWPRYSSILSAGITTAYEDRPIHELLKAHLAPLNGVVANSPENADLLLFINAPVYAQGVGEFQWLVREGRDVIQQKLPAEFQHYAQALAQDEGFQRTRREMETPQRSPEEFTRALLAALRGDCPAALADVAYVNGADLILGEQLFEHVDIVGMAGYGGWNTAGNTLGSVLSQAVIQIAASSVKTSTQQQAAHLEFLFLHFLDDYQYQAHERTRCMVEDLPALGFTPTEERLAKTELATEIEARVRERLMRAAGLLRDLFIHSGQVRLVEVSNIHLPWQRLFEVGFDVKVNPR